MNETITAFSSPQRIAVVGASPSRRKFGNTVFRELRARGYEVIPVHAKEQAVDGCNSFVSLSAIPNPPESAVVVVRPDRALGIVDDALAAGIRRIWFQRGADFSEIASKATSAGLDVVTGKCILMYAEPVTGVHAVHRLFARIFKLG